KGAGNKLPKSVGFYLLFTGLSKTSEIAEYIELSPARTRALLSDMTDVVVEGANKNRKYRLAAEE
ncbi:MAG: hypothetical protein MJZ84_08595, partial [Paludibacteraceae bacterium]|nr:hypothetical protein [Paludibacteraceae bacterium]